MVIDAAIKVVDNDLEYLATHQRDLRADQYRHVQEARKNNTLFQIGSQVPQATVLPSTFIGSKRNLVERYVHVLFLCTRSVVRSILTRLQVSGHRNYQPCRAYSACFVYHVHR